MGGLQPGTSVGPYEIVGSLGAGGMGEVYRARDPRLKRDVALKILPDVFADDPERLARFQREAEVLASLNHPNIAGIHGLEETGTGRALVLELVEGETLADRIARGPLPFDEAIGVAMQIAEALEAAHEHGIIHRDLKPANVKLRPDGTIKVLDFGLAKLAQQSDSVLQSGSAMSLSPTITSPALATGVGALLGTAAYMSPEQAKGRPADARSDVWSFGCVLFELVTGTRAFPGDDISDTIANVLRGEPDWTRIPASTPRGFARLLKRCLARDRRQRLHGIGDARLDLQELLTPPADEPVAAIRTGLGRRLLPYAITAAIVGGVVGAGVWNLRTPPTPQTQRFDIIVPDGEVLSNIGRHVLAVSPAGTHIVYAANNRLNLRPLDRLEATPISGSENGGRSPFFSSDGTWVGFWRDNKLFKVAVSGGGPIAICGAENPTGVYWGEDGTIFFGQGDKGILRVSAEGGTPETVVKLSDGSMAQSPQLLPGGDWILFTHRASNTTWDEASIVAQSIASGERRVLVRGAREGRYVTTGHIVYANTGTLFGIAFDIGRMETKGSAVPLLKDVRDAEAVTGAAHFALSMNGTLTYVPGWDVAAKGSPVWLGADGREEKTGISTPLDAPEHPRLSPDGRRLAMIVDSNLWVYDLEGRPPIRLTHDGTHYSPAWSPDGRRIFFESSQGPSIGSLAADGSETAIVTLVPKGHYHPLAITRSSTIIVTEVDNATIGRNTDIVTFPLDGKSEKKPLVKTTNREGWDGISLSPDERWMAYTSDATGQQEIWVQPHPGPGAPVRVSPNSGREPVWARNGKELYYLEGRKLMAVAVEAGDRFDFKPARLLTEIEYNVTNQPPSYDVASDGRFLMIKPSADGQRFQPIAVVLNWFEELKRAVPGH